jgi:hypothetical protein
MLYIHPSQSEESGNNADFHEGLASIPGEGYINRYGTFEIRNGMTEHAPFANGLASFGGSQPHTYGYINRSGRMVIGPHPWATAGSAFDQGYALIRLGGGLTGVIDIEGNWVVDPQSSTTFLRYDAGWTLMKGPEKQTLQNMHTGVIIERDSREYLYRFFGGLCVTQLPESPGLYGADVCTVLDERGQVAGQFTFGGAYLISGRYSDGLMLFGDDDSRCYGFLNLRGEEQIEPRYRGHSFREGLAPVTENGVHWGFINPQGNWAIPPHSGWSHADCFHEGVAAIRVGSDPEYNPRYWLREERWGYVDRQGEWLLPPVFMKARPFCDGIAHVEFLYSRKPLTNCNRQYSFSSGQTYIDQTGMVIYHPELAGRNINEFVIHNPEESIESWRFQIVIPF